MKKKKGSIIGKFSGIKWLIFMIIPTVYLLILTVFVVRSSLYTDEESVVNYNELGNIDYRVYLKDNNYYNAEYLDKNMQYIASIIDYVDMNFFYSLKDDGNLVYDYTYDINGELLIMDADDSSKILYNKPIEFVKNKKVDKVNDKISIDEKVKIDYDVYNDYVNSFKKEYAVSVKSKLVLTMKVNINGKSDILKEDFTKSNSLSIAIPMSEQTVDISIDTSDINSNGTLEKNYLSLIKKPVLFGSGIVLGIVSLILLFSSLYTLFTSRLKPNIYKAVHDNILKEYDRAIVNSDSMDSIDEDKYKIIEVSSFEEILDAHDSTSQPILYNELVEDDISQFILISNDILYKFVLSKEKLEKMEVARLEEKNKKIEDTFGRLWIFRRRKK